MTDATIPGQWAMPLSPAEIDAMLRDLPQPSVEVSSEAAVLLALLGGVVCFGLGVMIGVAL
jgi:hypothetical protein